MATIEMNMLSVITCGSVSVRVFCPEMDKLRLDDEKHEKKYPVLWLLHTDGGAALDWLQTPAERLAEKYGIFIIAPDQHHAMCTDMKYGPRYEQFMNTELPNICRNCLPISEDPAENYICGVGTGAYGAVKMALKHPETFSKAVSINGILDMGALISRAAIGENTGTPHTKVSLEAVFGDLSSFPGSDNDIYSMEKPKSSSFYFICEESFPFKDESVRLAGNLAAEMVEIPQNTDFDSYQVSLPNGVAWLMK